VVVAAVVAILDRSGTTVRRAGYAVLTLGISLLLVGQLSQALCVGTQEFDYRAEIGRYINRTAGPSATLLLEPTGYIPFFADRCAWDEVGLVAPEVTDYQRRYGQDWWFEFVAQKKPTYIIQRGNFIDQRVLYTGRRLSAAQRAWFDANYDLDREFHYDPADYWHSSMLLRAVRLATAQRYGVYRCKSTPISQSSALIDLARRE